MLGLSTSLGLYGIATHVHVPRQYDDDATQLTFTQSIPSNAQFALLSQTAVKLQDAAVLKCSCSRQ